MLQIKFTLKPSEAFSPVNFTGGLPTIFSPRPQLPAATK